MPQLSLQSAGVSSREVDLTGPTSIEPTGIPACVVSPTLKGPAFVPMIQPTEQDYRVRFGDPADNFKFGPLASLEWLKTQQSLVQVRVLGVGDGTQRTTSGNNTGKVTSAGFVVGDQQPQSSLSGALGANAFAVTSSTSPTAAATLGRTYFLGCFMSQSTNSTYLSDAGITRTSTPVVRGVLMAASGVIVTLSSANVNSAPPNGAQAADFSAGTVRGFWTGSLKMSSGLQEFVVLFNGHKGTDSQYPNFLTGSFDPTAPNYFGNVFNKDPQKLEQAGYVLYSWFDVTTAQAVPTGSGFVTASMGAGSGGSGFENIAFITTGSQARNVGTTTAPSFENWEDRFRAPSTPWLISQLFGGKNVNLFRVWSLSDGDYDNDKIKVSVENIAPSNSDTTKFGTFDLVVRSFYDTDTNKVILEQWRGLTLDPTSDRYVAKVVGDNNTFFNFDTVVASQKLQTQGEFANRSKYIRVEMSDVVVAGEVDETALPVGFRGHQHIVTSGSAPLPSVSDSGYYLRTNILYDCVQPPVPMRQHLVKGSGSGAVADNRLYWGVQFEQVVNTLEPNSSTAPNRTLASFAKHYPVFQTTWINFAARGNEGAADSAANGILDSDRFNNNLFSLEKLKIKYNTTDINLPDLTRLKDWTYVRQGGITTSTATLTRALRVSDLLEPSVRTVAKFTLHLEGGFNGTRIFNKDTAYLSNKAVVEEMNNTTRGNSNGPTVKSYLKAVDIIKDVQEVDIQLLTLPGIRHRFVTDTVISAVETDRFDCLFLMDLEERDTTNAVVSDSTTQDISVRFTANDYRSRAVNSSFVASYFPDVVMRDTINRTVERVPPSVAVIGALGVNDSVGYPWNAPAGFARGGLAGSVDNASLLLSRGNLDELYSVGINPIVAFPGQGPTVWGQKTGLASSQKPLSRVNVRRMLLSIRREVKKVGNRIMFEPNRETTLERFQTEVTPILKRVQDTGGLERFLVKIDTSTTTVADIENKTIRGKIFLEPTRTLEFLSLDFVITNRSNFALQG